MPPNLRYFFSKRATVWSVSLLSVIFDPLENLLNNGPESIPDVSIHFLRDNYYPNTSLLDNTNTLLVKMGYPIMDNITSQLEFLRKLDKKKGQKQFK